MKEFSVNVSDKSRSNIYIENGLLASVGKIITSTRKRLRL